VQYLLIITNGPDHPAPGGPGWDDLMKGYFQFSTELGEAKGHYTGAPLAPPSTATTVRLKDGERVLTDGPFAETKEWLSGYFQAEFDDLDDALAWAARIPSAAFGAVEVRPVMEM